MKNKDKSKDQLENELTELRRRISELEKCEIKYARTQESLRESERMLSTLIGNLPGMAYRCLNDDNWTMEFISEGCHDLTGYTPAELIGNRILSYNELIHLDDRYLAWEQVQQALVKCQPFRMVYRIQTATSQEKWVWEQGQGVFVENGDLLAIEGFITDITERILGEEALRESEKRFRSLLDVVPSPIMVFTLDCLVSYLNPAFTKLFGWTIEELKGKHLPYGSPEIEIEAGESFRRILEEGGLVPYETKRMTKDGRVLDVVTRGVVYTESKGEPAGTLIILRDITLEKIMARNKGVMRRISMALPEHPDLEGLLDYISSEVKRLLDSEAALVILLDEDSQELFFPGAAYDDTTTQKRVKGTRFHTDQMIAGKVIKTGKPIIVSDASKDSDLYPERDRKFGYHTRNFLGVPLKSSDRTIGVLCAINKKERGFDQNDIEQLSMISGIVALSIENARFSEELKKAHGEVMSLNRAKDKVISHLSHELKTPVSVLSLSLSSLAKKMADLPPKNWTSIMERARRNLDRIMEIQYVVEDIMRNTQYTTYHQVLSNILDQCIDELEAMFIEEGSDEPTIERVRDKIKAIYSSNDFFSITILLDEFVKQRLEHLSPFFSHRQIDISSRLDPVPAISIPVNVLQKIIDGLIRNAVENTPDEGKVMVGVQKKGPGAALVVRDCGVGITEKYKKRIFEGFFTTQETMAYSTKKPFDFNAGGKGADLLRMNIFAERYNFKIDMDSSRCGYLLQKSAICPGNINKCTYCKTKEDCYHSGATTFCFYFPPVTEEGQG
ncbi:MAG: PAS domain S-box protein [Deltaproteobacteria bacterium]|uniref:sensor histidine kinase n=1 Tax=Desulfobacula sp. TaxID=2593537 RepID=UPI0019A7B5FE|nr:PAS domain S-box protein [Candidatus Desulfobacula maris]MBL6993379.1 PAS domain S-box protein [Desulfobacula sp.]